MTKDEIEVIKSSTTEMIKQVEDAEKIKRIYRIVKRIFKEK